MHSLWNFTVDVASHHNAPSNGVIGRYWTEREDGLVMPWSGERVFCNPPYDHTIPLWLARAREADFALYLLPPSVDTAWFHKYVMGDADRWYFLRGRLRFGKDGKVGPAPRAGNLVAIYGR